MLVIGIQQCLGHTPQNLITGWKDYHSQPEMENPIHLEWLVISQQVQKLTRVLSVLLTIDKIHEEIIGIIY